MPHGTFYRLRIRARLSLLEPQMAPAKLARRKDDVTSSHRVSLQAELRAAVEAKLVYSLGKTKASATGRDWYQATALAIRDRVIDIWVQAKGGAKRERKKRVYYLSIEFLIGRLLFDSLNNLRLVEAPVAALSEFGVALDRLREIDPDPALGNGGLGRLAACFMDSMSAVGIPAYGYGICYENGLFEQRIHDGWQQESPEHWLAHGNPWEFSGRAAPYSVGFGGTVEYLGGRDTTASQP